ncbi:MAG TPA: hypothetical protein VH042_10670 [Solirubrobacterales bacterium]|nr:hypothetical protein [Solirubrobacterales bacterium]
MGKSRHILLSSLALALLLSAVSVTAAVASPAWKIGSSEFTGTETVLAEATKSTLTIPSLTTTCDFPVESVGAEDLPWALRGMTVKANNYVIFEGVRFSLLYEGPFCPLAETVVAFHGSAGGLYNNLTQSFSFNSSTFATTKTKLAALGTTVEWGGIFPVELTGANAGLDLEL